MLRVVGSFGIEGIEGNREAFDIGGLTHLRYFERALASQGRAFEDFDRLLDFGCGCGRFVRHFGSVSDRVEVHGTDIDAEMIEWLRQNVPFGQYEVAPHAPPLPYPDHHFDLVINHSVFTHLDEHHQNLWLAELQRITKPGALLLLTIEGQSSWNRTCEASVRVGEDPERWRAELETRGMVFIGDDHFVGSTHPDFYHSAVHAPWYVFEHWTTFFDLAGYLPDGSISQDLVIMRRREDGAAQPRPIGHRSPVAAPAPVQPERSLKQTLVDRGRAALLRRLAPEPEPEPPSEQPELQPEAVLRELSMLRAGLYEQGRRVSVLASELRRELDEARHGQPDALDGPGEVYVDPEPQIPDVVSVVQTPPTSSNVT